jgi:hypothetical protein
VRKPTRADPVVERGANPKCTDEENVMASKKQRAAARKNIKKAAASAKKKRTIAKLPKKTRTALGKQANAVKKQQRG